MGRTNPLNQRNDGGRCTCAECGRTFTGLTGFDVHRITATAQPGYDPEYDWRCAIDAELGAIGYASNGRGWWGKASQDPRFGPPMRTESRPGSVGAVP